jgi:hypothetical protein
VTTLLVAAAIVACGTSLQARPDATLQGRLDSGLPPDVRVAIRIDVSATREAVAAAALVADRGVRVAIAVSDPGGTADAAAFALKAALTDLRAGGVEGPLGVVASPARLAALVERDLAAYLDFSASPSTEWRSLAALRGRAPGLRIWVAVRADAAMSADSLVRLDVPDADAILITAETADRAIELGSLADRLTELLAPRADVTEQVTVVGARRLTADEIVARHQAHAVRQRRAVETLIATGRLSLTFEAPGFAAPVVVESETVLFQGRATTELQQRRIRVNGLEFSAGGVPRLPIIEPERVAAPPLQIELTRAYAYTLERGDVWHDPSGSSAIDCYVISFEPRDDARPLFRGRAWIAADSFALVRLEAAQTNLRGPITSSEQIDEYAPLQPASGPRPPASDLWLLVRSDVRQLYQGAGHRTPIRRVLTIERNDINPPDFDARRAAAHASDAVMLRDTAAGYRYLQKEAGGQGSEAGRRVVADRATRVRTIAGGVLIDPNISRPLPFAGLNYADFDFLRTGAQVNVFFGGSYGQFAWSVPSLRNTRWTLTGRGFGVLAQYNDRAFEQGIERYAENIRQRPAHAAVALVRPLLPRVTFRVGYELDYTHFARADTTAADFAVPAAQLAHAVRVELEAQRFGWTASAWWNPARRAGWRPWGRAAGAAYTPAHRDFQRWGAGVSRPFLLSRSVIARIETAWMDGRDLDRFSRYAFGTFDNRLRGYPSASVRYDRGAVARSAIVWQAASRLRLDGFLDAAVARDPGIGRRARGYTGVGAAVEAPAPLGTLVGVEWGYGAQGRNTDGSRGTHVVRVTAFKIF